MRPLDGSLASESPGGRVTGPFWASLEAGFMSDPSSTEGCVCKHAPSVVKSLDLIGSPGGRAGTWGKLKPGRMWQGVAGLGPLSYSKERGESK